MLAKRDDASRHIICPRPLSCVEEELMPVLGSGGSAKAGSACLQNFVAFPSVLEHLFLTTAALPSSPRYDHVRQELDSTPAPCKA